MNSIVGMRLLNRALIKKDSFYNVINVCNKYDIVVTLCTEGLYEDGPYIVQLVHNPNTIFTIDMFKRFVTELITYLDMYRGVDNITYLEFSIKNIIEKDGVKTLPIRNEIVVYYDHANELFRIKKLDPEIEKIKLLKAWQQKRISQEDIVLKQCTFI